MGRLGLAYFSVLLILSALISCNREDHLASRMSGTWDVSKIDVYRWNDSTLRFNLDTTYINPGYILLTDLGNNENHTEAIESCNTGNIMIPGIFYEGSCFWCVVCGSKNSLRRLEIMDGAWARTSFTIEKIRKNGSIWIRTYNDSSSLDQETEYKEVWELNRR